MNITNCTNPSSKRIAIFYILVCKITRDTSCAHICKGGFTFDCIYIITSEHSLVEVSMIKHFRTTYKNCWIWTLKTNFNKKHNNNNIKKQLRCKERIKISFLEDHNIIKISMLQSIVSGGSKGVPKSWSPLNFAIYIYKINLPNILLEACL